MVWECKIEAGQRATGSLPSASQPAAGDRRVSLCAQLRGTCVRACFPRPGNRSATYGSWFPLRQERESCLLVLLLLPCRCCLLFGAWSAAATFFASSSADVGIVDHKCAAAAIPSALPVTCILIHCTFFVSSCHFPFHPCHQ